MWFFFPFHINYINILPAVKQRLKGNLIKDLKRESDVVMGQAGGKPDRRQEDQFRGSFSAFLRMSCPLIITCP